MVSNEHINNNIQLTSLTNITVSFDFKISTFNFFSSGAPPRAEDYNARFDFPKHQLMNAGESFERAPVASPQVNNKFCQPFGPYYLMWRLTNSILE